MKPYTTGGLYLNFTAQNDLSVHPEAAYSADSYTRLQALKAQYDPENHFSFGFNIAPKGE